MYISALKRGNSKHCCCFAFDFNCNRRTTRDFATRNKSYPTRKGRKRMPQQSELILLGPHRRHSRADGHTTQKVDKKRKVQRNESIAQKRQKQCRVACKEYNTSHRQKTHKLLLQACKHGTHRETECTKASTVKRPTNPTTFQTSFLSL